MSTYTVCVNDGGFVRRFDSNGGETLLALLQKYGYDVNAPCGGTGTCRQCKVRVSGTLSPASSTEAPVPYISMPMKL